MQQPTNILIQAPYYIEYKYILPGVILLSGKPNKQEARITTVVKGILLARDCLT